LATLYEPYILIKRVCGRLILTVGVVRKEQYPDLAPLIIWEEMDCLVYV